MAVLVLVFGNLGVICLSNWVRDMVPYLFFAVGLVVVIRVVGVLLLCTLGTFFVIAWYF